MVYTFGMGIIVELQHLAQLHAVRTLESACIGNGNGITVTLQAPSTENTTFLRGIHVHVSYDNQYKCSTNPTRIG